MSTRAPSSSAASRSSTARALGDQRIGGGRACAARLRGGDDRLVAGAAAEVALQRRPRSRPRRVRVAHPERVERHHEARRAEAALAAVAVDHGRLHRVQGAVAGEVLDGDDVAEVDRGEQPDAGIHRLVDQPVAGPPADQHRAGAAVALGAALLGAAQPLRPAAGGRAACPTSGPRAGAPRGRSAGNGFRFAWRSPSVTPLHHKTADPRGAATAIHSTRTESGQTRRSAPA